jgi:hypothetical protein
VPFPPKVSLNSELVGGLEKRLFSGLQTSSVLESMCAAWVEGCFILSPNRVPMDFLRDLSLQHATKL